MKEASNMIKISFEKSDSGPSDKGLGIQKRKKVSQGVYRERTPARKPPKRELARGSNGRNIRKKFLEREKKGRKCPRQSRLLYKKTPGTSKRRGVGKLRAT